ncbi:MAG: NUDIX domain-containing protein [Planctomycetota bacterium]
MPKKKKAVVVSQKKTFRRPTQAIEKAFRHCPWCATPNRKRGEVPYRCEDCGFTFFFGPVAAVGGLIVNNEGELLLVRRAKNPGLGKWGLPGGFVDRGESIEEALGREILEETNLVITSSCLLTTLPNRYQYAGSIADVVDLFFVCEIEDTAVELLDGELDAFQWCVPSRKHLKNMAFESNRKAIELWMQS